MPQASRPALAPPLLAVLALLSAVALCNSQERNVGEGGLVKGGECYVHAPTCKMTRRLRMRVGFARTYRAADPYN